MHYQRLRKRGDPNAARFLKRPDDVTPEQWFWGMVKVAGDDECWEWLWTKSRKGYGLAPKGFGSRQANRVAYFLTHDGPLPATTLVRHTCDNPPCCNPSHLVVGTPAQNSADMIERRRVRSPNAERTHCQRGHAYTPENTYVVTTPGREGHRQCRTCTQERRQGITP